MGSGRDTGILAVFMIKDLAKSSHWESKAPNGRVQTYFSVSGKAVSCHVKSAATIYCLFPGFRINCFLYGLGLKRRKKKNPNLCGCYI